MRAEYEYVSKSWSVMRRYEVSDRVEISVQYKQFDMLQGNVGKTRIEIYNDRGGYKSYANTKYVARAIRILIERYDITPQHQKGDNIPLELALEGRPSIAVYLCGACDYDIAEVAEGMNVSEETVKKYVMRFDQPPYWSLDPDYETKFDPT